jgi:hypothetical protein
MKKYFMTFSLAIFFCCLTTSVSALSLGISSGNGVGTVSSSTEYILDGSTQLQGQAVLGEREIFQSRELTGTGRNHIDQSISGDKYSASNVIDSRGSISTSTSIESTVNGVGLHQSLRGSGDLSAALGGITASGSSSQMAEVANGEISSSQSFAAADGVYAGQSTKLRGEAGCIGSRSSSAKNEMDVSGVFSGEGNLEADLSAMASKRSSVSGQASFMGIPVLNENNMDEVASGEGLYSTPKGDLGEFGLRTANKENNGIAMVTSPLLTGPELTPTGGRSTAYCLLGYRWNKKDPQIKWYLRDDAKLRGEGLDKYAVQGAIAAAANTWDAATNQNLFADTNLVTISSTVKADIRDGNNAVAWNSFSPGALAYARTWYQSCKIGGYYSAIESDINLNTGYRWSTTGSGSNIDVQSVVLHEMGHTIGLGDLYGKSQFASDTRQTMHYYTGVKRTLGNGDKTGAWQLYK